VISNLSVDIEPLNYHRHKFHEFDKDKIFRCWRKQLMMAQDTWRVKIKNSDAGENN
jgi:hypothetical protein